MATKMWRMFDGINYAFSDRLGKAFSERFGREIKTMWNVEIKTMWNVFAMHLESYPKDGEEFTPEQHAWVTAYSAGYADATKCAEAIATQDKQRY